MDNPIFISIPTPMFFPCLPCFSRQTRFSKGYNLGKLLHLDVWKFAGYRYVLVLVIPYPYTWPAGSFKVIYTDWVVSTCRGLRVLETANLHHDEYVFGHNCIINKKNYGKIGWARDR
jgi:hypothetical protein